MPRLEVLRVFVGEGDAGGNPLGVFLDGGEVPGPERQRVAAELGFSETVFVDHASRGELRIFTPAAELAFAGHPLVGTAWLLWREGRAVDMLRPPAGEVAVRADADGSWIVGRPEWAPPFDFRRLASPDDVDALPGPPADAGVVACWAWLDEGAGIVRSRVFPVELGIREDEATGAAAVRLAAILGRPIEIRQGVGSVIHARPLDDGAVEIGGRVSHVASRAHRV